MKKKGRIPTILGILVLVIALASGVLLVQGKQIFKLGASPEIQPKDVRITNISDSSFTVSWTTSKESTSFVNWGESTSSLNRTENDEIKQTGYTHSATIRGLTPNATYYFKINVDGTDFDNNNIPWQASTGPALSTPTGSEVISGNVLTATGTPAGGALVYLSIGGASSLSTITSDNGSWLFTISSVRTRDLSSYYQVNPISDVLEISVQAGPLGTSSAQIFANAAKPAPPVILGQVHDFKALPPSKSEELPEADLNLPADASTASGQEAKSRFDVSGTTATSSSNTVTLESVDEGEVVTSTKPEFFGEAPPSIQITIKVESSTPITDTVKVDKNGDWEWTPPQGLEPGTHKITLSWRDVNGVLKTITKSFIVQAAQGPAFVSSPSATKSPTASPKSTATPSGSPKSTATPSSTKIPVPDSGTLTPTILLFIMGMGFVIFAASVYYLAREER